MRAISAPTSAARFAKFLRAVLRPHLELLAVGGQHLQVPMALVEGGGFAVCRPRERGVEVEFGHLEERRRRPQQPFARSLPRSIAAGVVLREDARLQLADPVPAFRQCQTGIALQVVFERLFVEPCIVEAAEMRCEPAQGPDQAELAGDDVDDEAEPRLAREVETMLGFALHVAQRVSGCQQVGVQVLQL